MSKTKDLRDRVASFRISRRVDAEIGKRLRDQPIINCDCTNKFYRKLVLDWMAGRLVYKNPEDAKADPEVLDQIAALSAPLKP